METKPTELPDAPADIDIPDQRDYDDPAHRDLDRSLVEAINRADDASHDYLSSLLRTELGSLYYEHGNVK